MTAAAAAATSGGGPRITLTGGSFSDTALSPFNPSVQYVLSNAGFESWSSANSGSGAIGNWITPTSAAGSNYEVRATVASGTTPSGTVGSWLSLGTSRSWELTTASVGTVTCDLTIEIRQASSGTVLATKTVTLTATKSL